jgi:hypothetical protein
MVSYNYWQGNVISFITVLLTVTVKERTSFTDTWSVSSLYDTSKFSPMLTIYLPSFPRFTLFSAFYPLFRVLPSFPRFTLFSAFYPLFRVLPSFPRFTLFSAFYPLFRVLPSFPRFTLFSVSAFPVPPFRFRRSVPFRFRVLPLPGDCH